MPLSNWKLYDWLSRIFAGGAIGCGVLVLGEIAISFPPPGRGDKRWDIAFFVAEIGLPAAFVVGGLVGLFWRRSREFRLTLAEFTVWSWVVALIAVFVEPKTAPVSPGFPIPMYKVVPRFMGAVFAAMALVGTVWLLARHAGRRLLSVFHRSDGNGGLFPNRGDHR